MKHLLYVALALSLFSSCLVNKSRNKDVSDSTRVEVSKSKVDSASLVEDKSIITTVTTDEADTLLKLPGRTIEAVTSLKNGRSVVVVDQDTIINDYNASLNQLKTTVIGSRKSVHIRFNRKVLKTEQKDITTKTDFKSEKAVESKTDTHKKTVDFKKESFSFPWWGWLILVLFILFCLALLARKLFL